MEKNYEAPAVTDYGDLTEITAQNNEPLFVDVPQGSPVGIPGGIVGSPDDPGMS